MEGITMNKRTILSLAIILLAFAAIGGATMAWFTDTATTNNYFTAGELSIGAVDEWKVTKFGGGDEVAIVWDNANPGECQIKEFEITNKGNKKVYIRFNHVGHWVVESDDPLNPWIIADGVNNKLPKWDEYGNAPVDGPDHDLVTIKPVDANLWTELTIGDDTYWYYNGVIDSDTENNKLVFEFYVCLDGPDTTNHYQTATYKLDFDFYAIQTTHYASFDLWDAGYYDSAPKGWYPVSLEGQEYKMTPTGLSEKTWSPTTAGQPNYHGW